MSVFSSCDNSKAERSEGYKTVSASEVTTTGSITATFPVAALFEEEAASTEVEIGMFRFRIVLCRGESVSNGEDAWVQGYLRNCSPFDVVMNLAMEVVDGANNCYKKVGSGARLWEFGAGRGRGFKELMLRSAITNPASSVLVNDCFTIRAFMTIQHPAVPPACTKQDGCFRYTNRVHRACAAFLAMLESDTIAPDCWLIVSTLGPRELPSTTDRENFGEVRVPAHRVVLAARSPVLRALLQTMPCAKGLAIALTGCEVEAVRAFVRFLYSDSCTETALAQHAWELLHLAYKCNVPALRTVCESYLVIATTEENAVKTLAHAHILGAAELKRRTMGYIIAYCAHVLKAPAVQQELSAELMGEVVTALVDAAAAKK